MSCGTFSLAIAQNLSLKLAIIFHYSAVWSFGSVHPFFCKVSFPFLPTIDSYINTWSDCFSRMRFRSSCPNTFDSFRHIYNARISVIIKGNSNVSQHFRQDVQMPYPWTRGNSELKRKAPAEHSDAEDSRCLGQKAKHPKGVRSCGDEVTKLSWFSHMVEACQPSGCITFDVPKLHIPAGSVLKHSLRVLDGIFRRNDPCIFKLGITHNPAVRWSNQTYGYQHAADGWTNMTVLFVTDERFSPAMLEAALINIHCGAPAEGVFSTRCFLTCVANKKWPLYRHIYF